MAHVFFQSFFHKPGARARMLRGAPAYEAWVWADLPFLGWVNGLLFKIKCYGM